MFKKIACGAMSLALAGCQASTFAPESFTINGKIVSSNVYTKDGGIGASTVSCELRGVDQNGDAVCTGLIAYTGETKGIAETVIGATEAGGIVTQAIGTIKLGNAAEKGVHNTTTINGLEAVNNTSVTVSP